MTLTLCGSIPPPTSNRSHPYSGVPGPIRYSPHLPSATLLLDYPLKLKDSCWASNTSHTFPPVKLCVCCSFRLGHRSFILGSWMGLRVCVSLPEVNANFRVNLHMGRRSMRLTRSAKETVTQHCLKTVSFFQNNPNSSTNALIHLLTNVYLVPATSQALFQAFGIQQGTKQTRILSSWNLHFSSRTSTIDHVMVE